MEQFFQLAIANGTAEVAGSLSVGAGYDILAYCQRYFISQ
jgi:hypothetical protein